MLATVFKKDRCVESFGVKLVVDHNGFRVTTDGRADVVLCMEVYRSGQLLNQYAFAARNGIRENILGVDPAECGVRILDALGHVIIALDAEEDPYPFMRPDGEQQHITENDVSVPPALTITDKTGSIWTLGFSIAPKDRSPDGEFAFAVLRNGLDTGEIASRIEMRAGKVKVFTCEGWKVWMGRSFF